MNTATVPWVEKYRPTQFEDIVLDPLNRVFFKHVIDKGHFPNLLFYGPPGTGKTTTIMNLINEYQTKHTRRNKETVIHLNASDERGVDIIRTQIYQFVRSQHIFESGCKFVILDEVDYMTKNAQQALKTLLQTCHQNVRFCLICNYISKIDESLQREFICVRFNQLPPLEIRQFVKKIAQAEKIQMQEDDVELLMSSHQSDIRSMINFMQSACYPGDEVTCSDESSPVASLNNVGALRGYPRRSELTPAITEKPKTFGINIKNAISPKEWHQFHSKLVCREKFNVESAIEYISKLSVMHNVNKKHILLGYMNQVLRKHLHLVTADMLFVFEKTTHSSDDMPVDDLVDYFVSNVADLYMGITGTS